jgi:hypothetical protein
LNPILEEQELIVLHLIKDNNVITEIRDINWTDWVISEIPLTEWTKAQDKWSEITYYRRYNLLSLLDLEVEDSDASFCREEKKQEEPVIWFDEEKFEWLKKVKDNYSSWKEAILACRKKYWVSKKWANEIQSLYN